MSIISYKDILSISFYILIPNQNLKHIPISVHRYQLLQQIEIQTMKNDKIDNWSRQQIHLIANLRERLSINNISKENHLIVNMTPNLQIKLGELMKMDILKHCTKQTVLAFIKTIPFLQLIKIPTRSKDEDFIRIQYENSERRLIVTGIHKKRIEQMLTEFIPLPRRNIDNNKNVSTKIISSTTNWVTIETINQDHAKQLQKFLRTKKKAYDINNPLNFKIEKRRIRIIIIKQDLFALLIDAMTENKAEQFFKNFQMNNQPIIERKDSFQNFISLGQNKFKSILVYRPMIINDYQKQEVKEDDLSDGFSQSNSLNSDIKDLAKANDIIQTSDQGIQAQNSGQVDQYSDQIQLSSTPSNNSPQTSPLNLEKQQKQVQDKQTLVINEINKRQEYDSTILLNQIDHTSQQQYIKKQQIQQQQINSKQQQQYPLTTTDQIIPKIEQIQKHNPLIDNLMFDPNNINLELNTLQREIQTNKSLYSYIPFAKMKRYFNEFKSINHKMLIELPSWMVSESEQERNRHKFYGSLCKPKIKHLRECQ